MPTLGDTSLVDLAFIAESNWGVTPVTPTLQKVRFSEQSLNFNISTISSEEIRSDRMVSDLVQTDAEVTGSFTSEMSYGNVDDFMAAALYNSWNSVFEKTGNVEITDITSTTTITVDAGAAVVVDQHLIKLGGWPTAANNFDVFLVSASTATTITTTGLADETADADSFVKVVGFEGETGDVQADSAGLTSTSLDFTTLGLSVGQWIKVGGTAAAEQFATAENNGWARITSIAATALVLEQLPSGWSTDTAVGKTIRVWIGDYLRNGTTRSQFTIERAHTDVNQFFQFLGMVPSQATFTYETGAIMSGEFEFLGKSMTRAGATVASATNAAPTAPIFNAVNDVALVKLGSSTTGIIDNLNLSLNNNLRGQKAISVLGNAELGTGRFESTGSIRAYFEDGTLVDEYIANTESSVTIINTKTDQALGNNQALVMDVPRVKWGEMTVDAGAINQDVFLDLTFTGFEETTLAYQYGIDRFYYFEE